MAEPRDPRRNSLIGAVSEAAYQRIAPQLHPATLAPGQILYQPNVPLTHAYFPTDGIVSLLYVMKNGSCAEMAVVGNEGVVGVPVFLGGISMPNQAIVQIAGHAYRIKAEALLREFTHGGAFQSLLLLYTNALLSQMALTAVCNRHHTVEQQLSRWLLLSLDRQSSNTLSMTQESIANMLGVRREGVTAAAGKLQDAGLILYGRGRINIIDRAGLERRACECYGVVRREFDRLLPPRRPGAPGTRPYPPLPRG